MASRYRLQDGRFVAYEGNQHGGSGGEIADIIDQALAEADLPPAEPPIWPPPYHLPRDQDHLVVATMDGSDYSQSTDYGQDYAQPQAGYYQQPQPAQQQYYAASSSSSNTPGSPTTYPPIYPAVSQYAASAASYGSQPAYDYSGVQGYTHTSASASATLNENEAELKRLRNTAASARFRAKKKRREQSLERQGREKREELQRLENRISELEQENKFLKSLILTPRSSRKDDDNEEAEAEDTGKGKGKEKGHGGGERRSGRGRDGVGTSKH